MIDNKRGCFIDGCPHFSSLVTINTETKEDESKMTINYVVRPFFLIKAFHLIYAGGKNIDEIFNNNVKKEFHFQSYP